MLRLLVLLSIAVVLCSAGSHRRWRKRDRNPQYPRHTHLRELPEMPDAQSLRESYNRDMEHYRSMAQGARDWPTQRERAGRQGLWHDRGTRRPWGRNRDKPRTTGAGFNFMLQPMLQGLFDGLEDMTKGVDFDFGSWGWDWLTRKTSEPWYQGPNVCEAREEKEEDLTGEIERHQVTSTSVCDETDSAYKCTVILNVYGKKTTVTVTYTCCYGYERVDGESGCPKQLDLKGLAETLQDQELDQLLDAVRSVQLQDTLAQQNFTVFAPTDEALAQLVPEDMPLSNVVVISDELRNEASQLRNVILGHLLPGFVPSTSMADEEVFDTVYPRGTIRINHYNAPVKMTTANCVRVTSANHLATNGVVHVVDRVLPTVTQNILDLVSRNSQLRTLTALVNRTGLTDTLRGPGQFTLFAPTEEAFRRLNQDTRDYLLQANSCLKKALQSHLLPNVICSSIVQGRGRTINALGEYLELNKTGDEVYVEGGSRVAEADIMGSNGVIHLIDKVIIPKQVLNVVDVAREAGATAVLDLIRKAGMTKTLREMEGFTMFVPTNEAIENLPAATLQELSRDADLLRDVLKYHVVSQDVRNRELYNDLEIDTLLGGKNKITVKEYSSFPFSMKTVKTVQCATLADVDVQSCNGLAHVVNKVLLPPVGDVLDVMAQHSRFSRLISMIKASGIADTLQRGPYTIFAPSNEAFDQVDPVLLKDLTDNKEKLKAFLAHHVTHDTLCCSGMSIHSSLGWYWKPVEMTLDRGSNVVFERSGDDILVDGTPIEICDMTATNGVVHEISEFLPSAAVKYGLSLKRSEVSRNQRESTRYQF